MEQKTEDKTNITNGCSERTESKEEKAEEILDKKRNRTPKTTRKSLIKEKNSTSSKIPMRVKEPECHQTASGKARNKKVTISECMGASKTDLESKPLKEKEIKTVSIEEISKGLTNHYKTDVFKTSKNSTKDCTDAMKSLTIDKRSKISDKNENITAHPKTSTPKASQESKHISPKIPLTIKPKIDSAHSGLTLKPNVMKGTVPKPFKFQSRQKIITRSKSVTENTAVPKIKKRSFSVRKSVPTKGQYSKEVKEKKAQKLEDNNSPVSSDKSETPEASAADSKNATFKKYSAFGGLRFRPKQVSTQLKGDIFDSNEIKTE